MESLLLQIMIFFISLTCVKVLRVSPLVTTKASTRWLTLRASELQESPLTVVSRGEGNSGAEDGESFSLAKGGSAQLRTLLESMPLTD